MKNLSKTFFQVLMRAKNRAGWQLLSIYSSMNCVNKSSVGAKAKVGAKAGVKRGFKPKTEKIQSI